MTREEREAAIRLNALKQFIGYDKDSEIVKETQKSIDIAIEALEQEPTTKNDLAQERYQDLKEYFGDKETTILEDKKEFKAWLERVKWHVKRADELARELEALKQESVIDKIRAEIVELREDYHEFGWAYDDALNIIDKYRAESEGKG